MDAQARFLATGVRSDGARLRLAALAVVLGALCAIAAISAISQQSAFSEYLNQARRCVELNDCPSRGGRTGALPLFHGASWIRLLAYSLRSGHDLTWVQSVVLSSWILSLPISFYLVLRYLGLRAATLALGLYFPLVLVGTDIGDLTYTNILPLPYAIYFTGLALFVERRRVAFAAAASTALAVAVSAEMGSIVMVPFHFLVVGMVAPRPVAALATSAVFLVVPFCLDSMDAALEILRQVPTLRFVAGLAISGGLVAVASRMSPQVLLPASAPAPDRVSALMKAALVYAAVAIWSANVFLMQGVPAPRYLLPAAFPFLYLVAERTKMLAMRPIVLLVALEGLAMSLFLFAPRGLSILQVPVAAVVTIYAFGTLARTLLRRRVEASAAPSVWPISTICLFAIAIALGDLSLQAKRGASQSITLGEAEKLISALYAAGHGYSQLLGSLQGPAADDLIALLTERDPKLFSEPARLSATQDSLLVIKVPSDAAARTKGVIAAFPVDRSRSAIVVQGDRPYLDWLRVRRCSWASDRGQAAYLCRQPRMDQPLPRNWPYVEFGDPLPRLDGDAGKPVETRAVRFEVPVQTPGNRRPHLVRVANEWPLTWQIVRVSGVEFEGTLPGPEIRLPDTREATGVVELEFSGVAPDLPWVWIPHVMEVAADNEHLLEPLRGTR